MLTYQGILGCGICIINFDFDLTLDNRRILIILKIIILLLTIATCATDIIFNVIQTM